LAGLIFFQRLFELDLELRSLFTGKIEDQAALLMEYLATTIAWLEHPGVIERDLEEWGGRYSEHATITRHYDLATRALLDTFTALLGAGFSEEAKVAWTSLCGETRAAMLRGAKAGQNRSRT